jgi:hypothetical protein
MAVAVLALEAVFFAVAFGFRTVVQLRATGDTGWRLRSGGAAAATGSGALLVSLVLAVAAPLADLAGPARWSALDRPAVAAAGVTLMVAGSLLTVWAQLAMGPSWRIGYDPSETTAPGDTRTGADQPGLALGEGECHMLLALESVEC